MLPGLVAIACDPLHRCFEIESCPGGEIAKLSAVLRKIHLEFPPRPGIDHQEDNSGRPEYYVQWEEDKCGGVSKSEADLRLQEEGEWGEAKCEAVFSRHEQEGYTSNPRGAREEYVELVMDILRSPDYIDQMRRKHKGIDVRTMMARALIPANAEYLLSGSRYIMARGGKPPTSLPVGTTTNEALAI